MFSIPKLSQPLTKAIRTSEGLMAWAVNIGTVLVTSLESTALPHQAALIVVAANTALHMVSRTLLKIFALQSSAGIGESIPFETEPIPTPATAATFPPETARKGDGPVQ